MLLALLQQHAGQGIDDGVSWSAVLRKGAGVKGAGVRALLVVSEVWRHASWVRARKPGTIQRGRSRALSEHVRTVEAERLLPSLQLLEHEGRGSVRG